MKICKDGCEPCKHIEPILKGVIEGWIRVKRDHLKSDIHHCHDLKIYCDKCNGFIALLDNNTGYYYHYELEGED